jgi:antitoxin (DNA-binding transcriptional repressor) of toxin-antitoxin stability system
MTTFEIINPDSQLTALLDRIAHGEEVVLTRDGHEVARVSPMRQNSKPNRIGFLKGKIQMSDNFDVTSQEIIDSFYAPLFPEDKA